MMAVDWLWIIPIIARSDAAGYRKNPIESMPKAWEADEETKAWRELQA
jgi:hypothetical protein